SEQEKTFGPTISGLIHKHIGPERLLLWDSKARGGRPDTMKILKEAYTYWDAEVVFITSNYIGNSEIMQGCKEAGIPAFGTLWDFTPIAFSPTIRKSYTAFGILRYLVEETFPVVDHAIRSVA
ncbi:hypothetical protein BDQ17DRAFT_1339479, partial [Cyathus striatus]